MTKKLVYLAGPMSGKPFFNFPAFFAYEEWLRDQGYDVWSPARNDIVKYGPFYRECPNGSAEELARCNPRPAYRDVLRDDLNFLLDTDCIVALMPGWENSKGARVEFHLAHCLNLEIMFLEELTTTAVDWNRQGITREVILIGHAEAKRDSFGWLDGRIVAVDYGN